MATPSSDPGPDAHLDPARWDALIECVGPDSILLLIERWMSARLRSAMSPEDIWQEVLVGAWRDRAQHRWESVRAYRAWLLEIARNRIRDAARWLDAEKHGGGKATHSFSTLAAPGSASISALLPPGSTTPSRSLIHRERAATMRHAIEAVPEEYRPVLLLYLFEERTMEEAASELGIGLSAAWYRFRKGSEIYGRALEAARTLGSREKS